MLLTGFFKLSKNSAEKTFKKLMGLVSQNYPAEAERQRLRLEIKDLRGTSEFKGLVNYLKETKALPAWLSQKDMVVLLFNYSELCIPLINTIPAVFNRLTGVDSDGAAKQLGQNVLQGFIKSLDDAVTGKYRGAILREKKLAGYDIIESSVDSSVVLAAQQKILDPASASDSAPRDTRAYRFTEPALLLEKIQAICEKNNYPLMVESAKPSEDDAVELDQGPRPGL